MTDIVRIHFYPPPHQHHAHDWCVIPTRQHPPYRPVWSAMNFTLALLHDLASTLPLDHWTTQTSTYNQPDLDFIPSVISSVEKKPVPRRARLRYPPPSKRA